MTVKDPKHISVVSPEKWTELDVTADSGACETVMPPTVVQSCAYGAVGGIYSRSGVRGGDWAVDTEPGPEGDGVHDSGKQLG